MSQITDKRCPLCGGLIKLHTGDVHSCSSCPFKCFEEDFDRVCAAMKTYASARKIAEWVIKRHRHTSACLDHDSLLFQCSCGYDEVEKFAKELLGDGGNNETQS